MKSRRSFLKLVLITGDIALMYLGLLLALAIRYGDFSFWPGSQTRVFVRHFSFIAVFWILLLFLLDFYKIPPLKNVADFFCNLIIFSVSAGSIATIYFYLQSQPGLTPKTILALDVFLFSLFLVFWRFLVAKGLEILGVKEKIVLIGPCSGLSRKEIYRGGFKLIKRFDLSSLKVSDLKKWVEKADSVVFEPGLLKREKLVREIFEKLPLKINYISFPEFYEEVLGRVPLDKVDEAWFLTDLSRPERKFNQLIKRVFDIFFSVIGLFFTVAFFPFIALAIKIDSRGPIFYCQKRIGKNRKIFTVCKFRTMKHIPGGCQKAWREKEADQITRVGRFLRRSFLDEMPQFWNVLKGELSFVGPRPEWVRLAETFEKEIPFYFQRYLVKPGLTGWAQINFPASTSVKEAREKFEYDLYYIKNRSFLLDLGIILKTVRIIFRR